LDIVVRRRDRFFEASGVWLFIALVIGVMWPNVLVVFVGILDAPLLSLVVGLLGTGLAIGWGIHLARGQLRRASGPAPFLVVAPDALLVWGPLEDRTGADPGPLRIPREAVDKRIGFAFRSSPIPVRPPTPWDGSTAQTNPACGRSVSVSNVLPTCWCWPAG
jgi:hypothetical protein